MTKHQRASSALWAELDSAEPNERGAMLAQLFHSLVEDESDDLFTVGMTAIDELEFIQDFDTCFEVAQKLSERMTAAERFDECADLIEGMLQLEHWVDRFAAGMLRWNYAFNSHQQNKFENAANEYLEAFNTFEECHTTARAYVLHARANCLNELGNVNEATTPLTESIALFEEEGTMSCVANGKRDLGNIYVDNGDFAIGARYLQDAITIYEFLGWGTTRQKCLVSLGRAQTALGSYADAKSTLEAATSIRDSDLSRQGTVEALFYLAELMTAQGFQEEAEREYARIVPLLTACSSPELAELASLRANH